MTIRPLTTFDDCRRVALLERDVWGYTDAEDIVPPAVLIVSIKRGGILLGAFDAVGEMKGFVYSIPGVKDGALTQWSHMPAPALRRGPSRRRRRRSPPRSTLRRRRSARASRSARSA